ncbi:MAG: hypothetical protein IJJ96_10250 [Bacteroidales bacterium]|jgi:hypothetical protein|nr:hypothetical protein [Bacteroidales bacterium]
MRKFLLKLLMGASLTTSVFIFQACYGTPVPPADVPRSQTELQEAVPEDPEAPSDVEENLEEKEAETLD